MAEETEVFDTAGMHEWTVPAGVFSVDAEAVGGGGAGSKSNSLGNSGSGGGGSSYAQKAVDVTPGQQYTIVVGAGGAGSTGPVSGGHGEVSLMGLGTAPANTIDVFLTIGQSNMRGLGGPGTETHKVPITNAKCLEWVNSDVGIIQIDDLDESRVEPYGPLSVSSAMPQFAIDYTNYTGREVLIVRSAVGGTSVLASNTGSNGDWSETGTLFSDSVSRLEDAIDAAELAGYVIRHVHVLLSVGHRDADAGNDLGDLPAALGNFVSRYRTATGFSSLNVYSEQLSSTGPSSSSPPVDPDWQTVRDAFVTADANTEGFHLAYTDGINYYSYNQSVDGDGDGVADYWLRTWVSDNLHYSTVGLNHMGAGFASYVTDDLDLVPVVFAAPGRGAADRMIPGLGGLAADCIGDITTSGSNGFGPVGGAGGHGGNAAPPLGGFGGSGANNGQPGAVGGTPGGGGAGGDGFQQAGGGGGVGTLTLTYVEPDVVNVSESDSLSAAESSEITISLQATDSSGLSVSEEATAASAVGLTDSAEVAVSDLSSLEIFREVDLSDEQALTLSEQTESLLSSEASDSASVSLEEQEDTVASLQVADAGVLALSESLESFGDAQASDSPSVQITEQATAFSEFELQDNGATAVEDSSHVANDFSTVVTSDASSIAASDSSNQETVGLAFSVTDETALALAETTGIEDLFAAIESEDAVTFSLSESAVRNNSIELADTGSITLSDTEEVSVSIEVSEQNSVSMEESVSGSAEVSAEDTDGIQLVDVAIVLQSVSSQDAGSIELTESSNIDQFESDNPLKVFVNGQWQSGVCKVYLNGEWREGVARVYKNGSWS